MKDIACQLEHSVGAKFQISRNYSKTGREAEGLPTGSRHARFGWSTKASSDARPLLPVVQRLSLLAEPFDGSG